MFYANEVMLERSQIKLRKWDSPEGGHHEAQNSEYQKRCVSIISSPKQEFSESSLVSGRKTFAWN